MVKKFTLLLVALVIVCASAVAQNKTVSGVVTDSNNEPIIGASVVVKGTTNGTSTDVDGFFELSAPAQATLEVSYIGYALQEVALGGKTHVVVVLEPDAQQLEDVVVVAYGTQDRRSLTGSVSTVKGEAISKRPVSNVSKALAGASAGVQTTVGSGQPGSSSAIRIRGVGSISASQDPLIVLDGVPYNGSLSSIVPSDIESMTVLKDAAANSMYGARGANGVILITTKRGKAGKTQVNVEIRGGINSRGVPAYETVRDPGEYLGLQWESLRNFGQYGGTDAEAFMGNYATAGEAASAQLFGTTYGTGGYTPYGGVALDQVINPVTGQLNPSAQLLYHDDWLDIPFKPAPRQEYIASMSGGSDKTSFFISTTYLKDEGYVENSAYERFSARAKVDHQAKDWIKLGMNMSYAKSYLSGVKADNPGSMSAFANMFMFAQQIAPIYPVYEYNQETGAPVYDSNGNRVYDYGNNGVTRPYGANSNPLAQQINDLYDTDANQVTALGYVEVKFLKDFKFTANVSAENYMYFKNEFQTPIGGDALNVNGRGTRTAYRNFALNSQQLLNYNKLLNDVHSVDVLLGHETNVYETNTLYGQKENFLVPDNSELDNAARISSLGSSATSIVLDSYFARGQYNYNSKYYFNASIRRDASSRFHPDQRWGTFWAVGASWRIDQEDFMQNTTSWLNELKLRASYGTQGNDNILIQMPGAFSLSQLVNAYEDQYYVSSQGGEIGLTYFYRGNDELTWEKSNNFNIGFDAMLWDRLSITAEYYSKYTDGLLYQKPLAPSFGTPDWIYENSIDMANNGFEVDLSYDILKKGEVKWNVSANLTYQNNELRTLPSDKDQDGYRNGSYYYKVGNSIYDYYTYMFAGVDSNTGLSQWYMDELDAEGNVVGKTTTTDYGSATLYEVGKSGLVDYYGGLSTTVMYKGFDLSVQTSFQIGGYGFDTQYQGLMHNMDSPGNGIHVDALDRWSAPGDVTDVPALQYLLRDQNATSDRFLTSKSAFTLQNVTLGYTLPESVNKKLGISMLRFYVTGDNLWLASARKGFDPRISFGGGTEYNYSMTRTVSVGVNLNF